MQKIELPITAKKDQFLDLLEKHPVVIVVGQTGSGKSTQVPQYCLESGRSVIITQPRRLAAINLARRVAEEMQMAVGDVVGYSIRDDKNYSDTTSCLFATDGLALVRELLGEGLHQRFDVLVIDEIHEWNLNQETLVAYIKLVMEQQPGLKLIIMSATMESEQLSAFFDGAPILNVEGRMYDIERRAPKSDLVGDTAALLREGRNVLVFQPGQREIEETIDDLRELGINAEILPLYSMLTTEDQDKCFQAYSRPKCVVSTNVAQTSITIPDIDAVVDSGMEKRMEVENGVQILKLRPISFKDGEQRAGRAGRCKPGIYINHCPTNDRLEFPVAEIMRLRLDHVVLKIMEAGFDPGDLEFFHQPDATAIRDAKSALLALGCVDKKGHITRIGSEIAQMPVSVKTGRMLLEAIRRGVVRDVLIIASIIEVDGILDRKDQFQSWTTHALGETQSDLLAQLNVWKSVWNIRNDFESLSQNGVNYKSFKRARDIRDMMEDFCRDNGIRVNSSENRNDILKSVAAGLVEHCYVSNWGSLKNGDQVSRQLDKKSIVRLEQQQWVVGLPFNIPTVKGELHLVKMATAVSLEWLMEVAPQLIRSEKGLAPFYHPGREMVMSTNRVYFASHLVEENVVESPNHPDANTVKAQHINQDAWQKWLVEKTTTVPLPSIEDDLEMHKILPVCFHNCEVTGVKMMAYGTVAVTKDWYKRFEIRWTMDKMESFEWYKEAQQLLAAKRKTYKLEKAKEELRTTHEPIKARINAIYNRSSYERMLSNELRQKIYTLVDYLYIVSAEFDSKLDEIKLLASEVESELDQVLTVRAETRPLPVTPTPTPKPKPEPEVHRPAMLKPAGTVLKGFAGL